MKASEIYLKAAEMIDRGEQFACCYALSAANASCRQFAHLYAPRKSNKDNQRWGFWMMTRDEYFMTPKLRTEIQRRRVLALLFMAQIAKDEERRK